MQNYTRLLVFVALFCCSIQADLPSNFQKCKRSGDDFNGCLKAAIQDAFPKCENGIPDLSIPVLEPFHVLEATIKEGVTGAVRLDQHYSNINIYNFTRIKIDKVEAIITETEFKLTIIGVVPEFIWDSDYDFEGHILQLPLYGKGQCYTSAKKINLILSYNGEIYEINGEKYIKINTLKMDFNPEGFAIELTNLFNGDEKLGTEMNKVLNENWLELWEDTKANYEATLEEIHLKDINLFMKKVPLGNIFPL